MIGRGGYANDLSMVYSPEVNQAQAESASAATALLAAASTKPCTQAHRGLVRCAKLRINSPIPAMRLPPPCLRRFGIQLARSPVGPGRTRIDASRASLDPGIALRQTSGGPSSTGGPGRTLAPEPNDGWRQLSHLSSALTPRRGGGVRGQAATDSRQLLPSARGPGGSFPHPVTSDGAHASPTSGGPSSSYDARPECLSGRQCRDHARCPLDSVKNRFDGVG
jgi:hypothetical protein